MDPGKMAEWIEKKLIEKGWADTVAYDRARQIVREFLASRLPEVPIPELGVTLYDKNKGGK